MWIGTCLAPGAPADPLLTLALLRFFLLPGMPPLSPPTLKMTKVLEGTETKGGAKEKL